MKKLMMNGKQVEIDESSFAQLSDDELADACGGTGEGAKPYYRLVCDTCNFQSWWGVQGTAQRDFLNHLHQRQGCRSALRGDKQYFESDPNL